jgi:probable F420-dependent oxidoreductase
MRELVRAVRAIWDAWDTHGPLRFAGAFYRHTLMPPAFVPGRLEHGRPPIGVAAVQERMTEVAGEVADLLLVHPLQTPEFVADVLRPALRRGEERAGRTPGSVAVGLALFVATSEAEREDVRRRVAFYASTPAYRAVLDLHGHGPLGERLHALSRTGGWAEMPGLIPDDVLDRVCVAAPSGAAVATEIRNRYSGLVERVNLHAGEVADLDAWAAVAAAWRASR